VGNRRGSLGPGRCAGIAAHWVFYEANANGQWAFFDPPVTEQITVALADLLQEGQP
jgi:hypothetical protein